MKIHYIATILLFFTQKSIAQSITIVPNDFNSSINSSKIGDNMVKIEGKKFTDNLNLSFTHGNANLKLIGNPNSDDFLSFGRSENSLDFMHGTVSRWSIGDFYKDDPTNPQSYFFIKEIGNSTTRLPFVINKGTNVVGVSNLNIGGLSSSSNDNRFLKISTLGTVIAAPNQFLNLGALDITTLGTGTITKDFAGSYGPNATSQSIYIPIHIPDDSKIVKFTVTYLDNSPLSSLSVSLVGTPSTIATVTSTNLTVNSTATMSPTVYIGSLLVDNEIKQYYFEIKPRNQANTLSGNWDNALLKIQKIVLEYQ